MAKKTEKKDLENRGFIAVNNPGAPWNYVEAYKSLRTNLNFVSMDKKYQKIIVSSSIPKEGKTGLAINLAISLAESSKRVLLMDCDLRKPMIHNYLKLEHVEGVTNLVTGQSVESLIQKIPGYGFDFIDAGVTPPNPVEILGSNMMKDAIDKLCSYYDYVIFDTPPAGVVTDAAVLSLFTDGVLFVVRQKLAKLSQIRLAINNLESVKADIIGCVLNDFEGGGTSKNSGYYYNYSYGYGYKY